MIIPHISRVPPTLTDRPPATCRQWFGFCPWWDSVGLLGSGGGGEVEPLEVGGPGPVKWAACPPGIEADQVEGGSGGGVFEAGFGQSEVAGGADAGDVGGLADGGFGAGAD